MRGLKSFTFIVGLTVNAYTFKKFYQVFRFYKGKYDQKIQKLKICMMDNFDGKF